nr:trypsin [Pseudomonadota bacterium]
MRNLIASALLCLAFAQLPVSAQTRSGPDSQLFHTDPDQIPVRLETASVVVEPASGMVRTTIEMVFRNPNARVLEGHLQFPLRPGQQVTGFALDISGAMREAVPVEKARGRQVFEAIERRNIDPALLEQTEGDFFRLRVYPFPAGGTRRVRVDLLEPLVRTTRGGTITLPLQFAEGLAAVDI